MPTPEYRAYMASWQWKSKSEFVKNCYRRKCYICGYDWKKREGVFLECHHTLYYRNGESILGKERPGELVPLCSQHHPVGRADWGTLRTMKALYLGKKLVLWLAFLPFRAVWAIGKASERR